jgi:hypothetical protein
MNGDLLLKIKTDYKKHHDEVKHLFDNDEDRLNFENLVDNDVFGFLRIYYNCCTCKLYENYAVDLREMDNDIFKYLATNSEIAEAFVKSTEYLNEYSEESWKYCCPKCNM